MRIAFEGQPAWLSRYVVEIFWRGGGTITLTCAQCGPFLDVGSHSDVVEVLYELHHHEQSNH